MAVAMAAVTAVGAAAMANQVKVAAKVAVRVGVGAKAVATVATMAAEMAVAMTVRWMASRMRAPRALAKASAVDRATASVWPPTLWRPVSPTWRGPKAWWPVCLARPKARTASAMSNGAAAAVAAGMAAPRVVPKARAPSHARAAPSSPLPRTPMRRCHQTLSARTPMPVPKPKSATAAAAVAAVATAIAASAVTRTAPLRPRPTR